MDKKLRECLVFNTSPSSEFSLVATLQSALPGKNQKIFLS